MGRLRVTSPTDSAASVQIQRFRSGGWYVAPGTGQSGALGLSNNKVFWVPFIVSVDVTLDRIGVHVTAGGDGTSKIGLAVYDSGADGDPDSLLLDAGTVSSTTAGIKVITISGALTAGVHWLAVRAHDASAAGPSVSASLTVTDSLPLLGAFSQPIDLGDRSSYTKASQTSFPATANPDTVETNAPRVLVRAA